MQEQLVSIQLLLEDREIKKAEILIAKSLRNEISSAERAALLLLRARAKLLTNRHEDALDDLLTARTIREELFQYPSAIELLADTYFARFEGASMGFADRSYTDQAKTLYSIIINEFPDYSNLGWIHYQMGRIQLSVSDIQLATMHFQNALLSPSTITTLTAYCYERLGFLTFYELRDREKALSFLTKAADTYPVRENRIWLIGVHTLRSRVLREMKQYDQAFRAVQTALNVAAEAGPDSKLGLSEALLAAGELMAEWTGHERETVSHLQHYLQITRKPLGVDVTRSRVYEMLGNAYFHLHEYELAADAYKTALQFNPYHPWEVSLHYRIARCYYQQRAYESVVEAIDRMLKASQTEGHSVEDYRVFDVLGNAHFALEQYHLAAQAYEQAIELAPPNAENLEKIKTYYRFAKELIQHS